MPSAGTITTTPLGRRLYLSPTNNSYTNRKIVGTPGTNNEHYIGTGTPISTFLTTNNPTLAINWNSFREHLQFLYLEYFSNGQIFNPSTGYSPALDGTVWDAAMANLDAFVAGIPGATPTLTGPNGAPHYTFSCWIRNFNSTPGSDIHLSFTSSGAPAAASNAIIRNIILPGISQLSLLELNPGEFLLEVGFVEGFDTLVSALTYGTASGTSEPRNLLVLGAPGTGKSNYLEGRATSILTSDTYLKKVAFNPASSYASFIGEYRPIMLYEEAYNTTSTDTAGLTTTFAPAPPTYVTRDGTAIAPSPLPGKPKIAYEFVPGPFSEALKLALDYPNENVVLLIDEINRGDIFETLGEVFQLMERYPPPASPAGRYELSLAPEIMEFLEMDPVRLPENFYLWATMNPNDASVQVIDSAFIRRWTVDYYDAERSNPNTIPTLPVLGVSWERLRETINTLLESSGLVDFEPIGRWFIKTEDCSDWDRFYSKFIFYLANYVVRDDLRLLFNENSVEAIMKDCRDGNNPFDPTKLTIFTTAPAPAPSPAAPAPSPAAPAPAPAAPAPAPAAPAPAAPAPAAPAPAAPAPAAPAPAPAAPAPAPAASAPAPQERGDSRSDPNRDDSSEE